MEVEIALQAAERPGSQRMCSSMPGAAMSSGKRRPRLNWVIEKKSVQSEMVQRKKWHVNVDCDLSRWQNDHACQLKTLFKTFPTAISTAIGNQHRNGQAQRKQLSIRNARNSDVFNFWRQSQSMNRLQLNQLTLVVKEVKTYGVRFRSPKWHLDGYIWTQSLYG